MITKIGDAKAQQCIYNQSSQYLIDFKKVSFFFNDIFKKLNPIIFCSFLSFIIHFTLKYSNFHMDF
jgi:hypothetical protein